MRCQEIKKKTKAQHSSLARPTQVMGKVENGI